MAAALVGCGRTLVPVSGVPVRVAIPAEIAGPGLQGGFSSVHAFMVSALKTNTGAVYIGTAGLDRTTLDRVLVVLPIPTVNQIPTFSVSLTAAANALRLSDLWIDADVSTNGVLVSAVVA